METKLRKQGRYGSKPAIIGRPEIPRVAVELARYPRAKLALQPALAGGLLVTFHGKLTLLFANKPFLLSNR